MSPLSGYNILVKNNIRSIGASCDESVMTAPRRCEQYRLGASMVKGYYAIDNPTTLGVADGTAATPENRASTATRKRPAWPFPSLLVAPEHAVEMERATSGDDVEPIACPIPQAQLFKARLLRILKSQEAQGSRPFVDSDAFRSTARNRSVSALTILGPKSGSSTNLCARVPSSCESSEPELIEPATNLRSVTCE